MDLSFIGDNTFAIGVFIVLGFCVWKFIIQPIMNEGQPIKPDPNKKTFLEEMTPDLSEVGVTSDFMKDQEGNERL